MKTFIFFIFSFFLFVPIAFGKSVIEKIDKISRSKHPKAPVIVTRYLVRQKFYFAAIPWSKKVLQGKEKYITKKFDRDLDIIITSTGFASYQKLSPKVLSRSSAPAVFFMLARKAFDRKDYKSSLAWLAKIPASHKYYPESLYLKGSMFSLLGQDQKSLDSYKECVEVAKKFKSKSSKEKVERFFNVISEKCTINSGRQHYGQGRYKLALKDFDKIPKTSYIWPYVLMERAWSYYNLKDFNRTLGILTTYKAPLLESYFFPGAEVLSGLSYLNMCLWQDTLTVIRKFHNEYARQSDLLGDLLNTHAKTELYFFNMMFELDSKEKKKNPYFSKLLTQIRKKIYFNFQLKYYRQSQRELENLKKWSQHKFISDLVGSVKLENQKLANRMNDYIREKMFFFVNETNRLSEEMYNVQLELFSRKKDVIYASKEVVKDRSRGSYENVQRTRFQYFWKFKGGFWADELGDFVFGLKSNCQSEKNKEKENG